MATEADSQRVETIINYSFHSKDLLMQALTAAGAEESNRDGNRKLALIGTNLIRLLLSLAAFHTTTTRAQIAELETSFTRNDERASVARTTGIDGCIKYDERPGGRSDKVLALAINAIIGSVYQDTNHVNDIWRVMARLRLIPISLETEFEAIGMVGIIRTMVDPKVLLSDREITEDNSNQLLDHRSQGTTNMTYELHIGSVSDSMTSEVSSNRFFGHSGIDESIEVAFLADPEVTEEQENGDDWVDTLREDLNSIDDSDLALSAQQLPQFRPDDSSVYSHHDTALENEELDTSDRPLCANVSRASEIRSYPRNDFGSTVRLGNDKTKAHIRKPKGKRRGQGSKNLIRCLSRDGHSVQSQTILNGHTQNDISSTPGRIDKFVLHIASSDSIATIRDILQAYRKMPDHRPWHINDMLSKEARFNIIEELTHSISVFSVLRRYHILYLYEQCGGPSTVPNENIIVDAGSRLKGRRQRGNPRYMAEAQIIDAMMKEIFPQIGIDSREYSTKRVKVKSIRREGKRLYLLKNNFGDGILGLLPYGSLAESSSTGTSDKMISSLTDRDFDEIIKRLEPERDTLRKFSGAIFKMLKPLLDGTLQMEPFAIEKLERTTIISCSKGSPDLLQLIS
ncbi:hypothetical protein DTO271G3_1140 [Paecilomyces variotii]|nr:hypothetical protein DTO271G3_1140 [Paecilomyces variotii]